MARVIQYGTTIRVLEANANQVNNTVFLLTEDIPVPPQPPSPEGSFTVMLYKNSSEHERVDKTNYLTAVESVMCVLRGECSIINPELTLALNRVPDFNYVYIPIFKRYYYVNDFTSLRKDLWAISLSIDVLMTYKDGIKKLDAFVVRNEHTYNDWIIDDRRVIEQGYDIDTYTLTNEVFDADEGIAGKNGSFIVSGFAIGTEDNPDYVATTEEGSE